MESRHKTDDIGRHTGLIGYTALGPGSLIAVLLLAGVSPAADWSVASTLSQRIEFDDRQNVSSSEGYVIGSTTRLATTIQAFTPNQSFSLSQSFDYFRYEGPGAGGLENRFNYDDFSVNFSKSRKLTNYSLSGSFTRTETSVSEFEDSGVISIDAQRLSFKAGAAMTHQVNSRNSVSVNTSVNQVEFTENATGLTPFFSATSSVGWSHSFTSLTKGNLTNSVSYSQFDNAQNRQSWVFASTLGLSTRLTKRLSISGNIGGRLAVSQADMTASSAAIDSRALGATGDVQISYKRKRTGLSLGLSQSVQPSSTGELQNRTALSLALNHSINSKSSAALQVNASISQSVSDTGNTSRKTLSISPTFTRKLNKDWNGNLGYQFRYSDDDTDRRSSSKVFMSVSRGFVVIP